MHRAPLLAVCAASLLLPACVVPADGSEAVDEVSLADRAGAVDVDSAGCREVANVGFLPTANVRPLVPSQFALLGDGAPTTPFVIRTVHCEQVSVDGKNPKPGNIVQIGALIVGPDGDGDINNYTLFYDTSDAQLAEGLKKAGVPARLVPGLEESLQVAGDGSGQYHFGVPAPFEPQLTFDGPVGAPSATPIPFTANWWSTSDAGTVKMASTYPELFYSGDAATLTVPPGSSLAGILGTTTVSDWPVLVLFDNFPSAHMHVTVR
jgi:hypothetical protein